MADHKTGTRKEWLRRSSRRSGGRRRQPGGLAGKLGSVPDFFVEKGTDLFSGGRSLELDLPDVRLGMVADEEEGPVVARDSELRSNDADAASASLSGPEAQLVEDRHRFPRGAVDEMDPSGGRVADEEAPAVGEPLRVVAEVREPPVLLRVDPVDDDPRNLRAVRPRQRP